MVDSGLTTVGHRVDLGEALRLAPIGLAILDKDLRYVWCNEALAEINGISCEDHVGRTVSDIVPGIAAEVKAPFLKAFKTGGTVRDLKVVGDTRSAPGFQRCWVENVTPLRMPDGSLPHILVTVQEVTSLVETEEALRKSQSLLEAYQSLSHDAFTILCAVRDRAGTVVDFQWEYANPAAQRLLKAGPLIGKRLLQTLPANRNNEGLFPRYVRLLESSESDEVELPYHDDNISGWFRNSAVPLGRDRLAVAFSDISAKKDAEVLLKAVTEEYQHRLKNIMAVVSALVHQAGRRTGSTEMADILFGQINALGQAQDLLTISHQVPISLESVVANATAAFRPLGLKLGPSPLVMVKPEWVVPLSMAFHELATNATKYGALSADSGRVAVSWRLEGSRVVISWEKAGGPVVVSPAVQDGGPGGPSSSIHSEGFGSWLFRLVERSLPFGKFHRRFNPHGVQVEISFCGEITDIRN